MNSAMAGFTQSETSAAWCGNTVVAGYNDSGAFARTAGVDYFGPWSFSSASYSNDGGRTFVDIGFLNPGTNPINFIAGDPVLACTSPTQFYYASIFASGQDSSGAFFNGVALNISSDGGQTWGNPVAAVAKDFNHGIDKPWLAADPTNANRLYVTYTDFDLSGFFGSPGARCPNDIRYAIELVASANGGSTWGTPVIVHEECFFAGGHNGVQGSNPVVAQDGTVYVGYEFYPGAVPNKEIRLAKSTDHGQTFGAPVKVSNVLPNGNFGLLQGSFRNNEFPQVAVDRSRGASQGTIYVAGWKQSRRPGSASPFLLRDLRVSRRNGGEVNRRGSNFYRADGCESSVAQFQGPGSRSVPSGRCGGQKRECGRLLLRPPGGPDEYPHRSVLLRVAEPGRKLAGTQGFGRKLDSSTCCGSGDQLLLHRRL